MSHENLSLKFIVFTLHNPVVTPERSKHEGNRRCLPIVHVMKDGSWIIQGLVDLSGQNPETIPFKEDGSGN